MGYDVSTLETRKGILGEEIVREYYRKNGAEAHRPDGIEDGSASLIDFHVRPHEDSSLEEHLAEVKVRKVMQFAYGLFPCYTFPVNRIEHYKAHAERKGLPLLLWVIDPKDGKIFVGSLDENGLERTVIIDGREFPFNQDTKCGYMRFYHRKQFIESSLSDADIRRFQDLEDEYATAPQSETQIADNTTDTEPPWGQQSLFISPDTPHNSIPVARTARILQAPNGARITLLAIDNSGRLFVPAGQVGTAIGYANYDITKTRATNVDTVDLSFQNQSASRTRQIISNCFAIEDVPQALESYVGYTYGARQGSTKYNRHMEASRLAVWWKNVVLEK